MNQKTLKKELAEQVVGRQAEGAGYQMNIDNYTMLLERLPSEWPEKLLAYKNKTIEEIVAYATNGEDIELISDLVFRDKIVTSLKQEQLQQRISAHLLAVLTERHDAIVLVEEPEASALLAAI